MNILNQCCSQIKSNAVDKSLGDINNGKEGPISYR